MKLLTHRPRPGATVYHVTRGGFRPLRSRLGMLRHAGSGLYWVAAPQVPQPLPCISAVTTPKTPPQLHNQSMGEELAQAHVGLASQGRPGGGTSETFISGSVEIATSGRVLGLSDVNEVKDYGAAT